MARGLSFSGSVYHPDFKQCENSNQDQRGLLAKRIMRKQIPHPHGVRNAEIRKAFA